VLDSGKNLEILLRTRNTNSMTAKARSAIKSTKSGVVKGLAKGTRNMLGIEFETPIAMGIAKLTSRSFPVNKEGSQPK
jgi:hypothetical protein